VTQQLRPDEEARGKDEFEILRHTVLLLLLLLSMFIGEFLEYVLKIHEYPILALVLVSNPNPKV